jgi:hypothetical protein
MTGSSEVRLQRWKNVGPDVVKGVGQRLDYRWTIPVDCLDRDIIEDWNNHRLGLHLHVLWPNVGPQGEGAYVCCLAHPQDFVPGSEFSGNERPILHHVKGRVGGLSMDASSPTDRYDMQQPMLVDVIENLELPEGVKAEIRPPVIRLHPLDFCLRRWVYSPDLATAIVSEQSRSDPRSAPSVYVTEDREFTGLCDVVGEWFGVRHSEAVGQQVQRRAEVVQALSDHHGQWIFGWLFGENGHQAQISLSLRVGLQDFRVTLAFLPREQIFVYPLQVLMRPLDLPIVVSHG